VAKASASDEQDQRRLLLSVNHKGTILAVNRGTPPANAHSRNISVCVSKHVTLHLCSQLSSSMDP
jgi:hypothetical protein